MQHDHVLQAGRTGGHVGNWLWSGVPRLAICRMLLCTSVCRCIARFDNMVLEIWSDPEITAETGYEYTRAIQFQCLGIGPLGCSFSYSQQVLQQTAGGLTDLPQVRSKMASPLLVSTFYPAYPSSSCSGRTRIRLFCKARDIVFAKLLQSAGHPCCKRCSTGLGRWVWSPTAPTCGPQCREVGETFSVKRLPI